MSDTTGNSRHRRRTLAAVLGGVLIVVALLGSILWDSLWMALLPAAALVVVAVREVQRSTARHRISDVGALAIQAGVIGLLLLALVAAIGEARLGIAPPWIAAATVASGMVFMAGAAVFGIIMWRLRAWPRWPAFLFSFGFPLGLVVDAVTRTLPQGELLFFAGSGAYIGLGLFAVALVALGLATDRAGRRSSEAA